MPGEGRATDASAALTQRLSERHETLFPDYISSFKTRRGSWKKLCQEFGCHSFKTMVPEERWREGNKSKKIGVLKAAARFRREFPSALEENVIKYMTEQW